MPSAFQSRCLQRSGLASQIVSLCRHCTGPIGGQFRVRFRVMVRVGRCSIGPTSRRWGHWSCLWHRWSICICSNLRTVISVAYVKGSPASTNPNPILSASGTGGCFTYAINSDIEQDSATRRVMSRVSYKLQPLQGRNQHR